MDPLTRRKFLLASAGAGGAAAIAASGFGFAELLATARGNHEADADDGTDKLVLVTLYGGNDGLNTVIPYADPAYHSARPELAYAPEKVLHLDDSLGLNPVLTGLKRCWDSRQLAVVLGVGYPRPDRSHFRSMDIWQTGSPEAPVPTGWVGRWLDGTNANAEAAVSFEPALPPLLVGETRVGACVAVGGLQLPRGVDAELVAALGRLQDGESELQVRAAESYQDFLRVNELVEQAANSPAPPEVAELPPLPATATGGASSLAAQLALVSRCVEAGVPTRVYSVSLGGFDTHANERVGQEWLLKQLDEALSAFLDRMAKTKAGRRVTVAVYSEFGRRVRANASDGTDHGTAGPLLVMGPGIAGGFYGEQPSLTDLDDGDLKATTDFRDVFGTLLGSVLRADPAQYLNGYQPKLLPLVRGRV
ncbi:Uncharacterized conserved protein, DUF1501 family [Micromonospora echinaurantiaca]|uniref:Uncharacterized conserved protein, DUF1501 family n=1 Tax=Micromonospora echinaurantiaca TaxID=47857 RepID=A0A1C5JNR9_9ACTN|nr:DUF1501 domain-containing protein [Micromonospora echinaurantiaca]SCG72158.1 Uncharacterized conserved protein, DUF1501 family [Micromonospora echinaurantiaca]